MTTTSNAQTESRRDEPVGSVGLVLQDTYTLRTCIGEGGMGEVYEASHVRLPGKFAVKILRPTLLSNPDAVARFCREAEIMSALRHPHIVQICDFNTAADGRPYFVMEYLDGADLETCLGASPSTSLADVVNVVEGVASALGAAHALGVVHRDLKPANIFLIRSEGGEADFVKVIDFGISKTMRLGPRLSRASLVMGTPAFMSPEQALGLTDQIDGRTDQFALAGIAFLMLTGREPFRGDDPTAQMYQVVHEEPPRLSELLAWDTTRLQSVLDRAFAKNPTDRFPSVGHFAAAFVAAADVSAAHVATDAIVPGATVGAGSDPVPERKPLAASAPAPVVQPFAEEPPVEAPFIDEPVEAPLVADAVAEAPRAPAEPLPRSLDRVPRGPERAVVLGLAVLALAGVIVHRGWYEEFPQRAAKLERVVVSQAQHQWRAHGPALLR
jgi:serine/threonine protein kinase